MIAIVDYGAGNLHSVKKALDFLGADNIITDDKQVIENADGVILPGVGSFGHAMESMHKSGLTEVVKKVANGEKPFLGICLGLQLLFERSDESPNVKGLGVLQGEILNIPRKNDLKVPHIGWNSLDIKQQHGIFKDIDNNSYVYFVHSFYLKAKNKSDVAVNTSYGVEIDAGVQKGNLCAVQFHPEKSGDVGLKMLSNFIEMCRRG